MLKHNVDLVQPLIVRRGPPYAPIALPRFDVHASMTDAELLEAFYAHTSTAVDGSDITPRTGYAGSTRRRIDSVFFEN